jgi:hypothetical protein
MNGKQQILTTLRAEFNPWEGLLIRLTGTGRTAYLIYQCATAAAQAIGRTRSEHLRFGRRDGSR